MYFSSSLSSKCPDKDHIFLTVRNILTFCLNSQIGSRHSDLFMVFISKTDDKGVWTLLQWTPVKTYYFFKPNVKFCFCELSSGIMHLCYPTNPPKLKLRTWRHENFCQDYYRSKKRKKKIPIKHNVGHTHILELVGQMGIDSINSKTKDNAVALCSHNTLPKAVRV